MVRNSDFFDGSKLFASTAYMVYQKTVKQNKPVSQWRLNGTILLLLLTLLQQVSLKMIIFSNMGTKKSFKSNWRGTTPNLFFYKMEPLTTWMGPYQTQLHIAFFLLSNDDSFFWTAVRIKSEVEPFFLCILSILPLMSKCQHGSKDSHLRYR